MEVTIGNLERWVNERGEERKVIIGRDFNTRTGRERGELEKRGEEIRKRGNEGCGSKSRGQEIDKVCGRKRVGYF